MRPKKTAVVEDVDAFLAWLSTVPIVLAAAERRSDRSISDQSAKPAAASADKEFLEALKSMA